MVQGALLKIENIDVEAAINSATKLIADEPDLSPALRAALQVLLLLVSVLLNRTTLNSKNSSKPPSSDPNRFKSSRKKSDQLTGGQKGHVGTTLKKEANPDIVEYIKLDRRTLPKGTYCDAGVVTRQLFDIDISRIVTEYQAQVLKDEQGKCFIAPFPEGVTKAVQYGKQIKAHAVYLSQYQLLPYKRIQMYFADQLKIPLSEGSLFNFNQQAFMELAQFEQICKDRLAGSNVAHADETGININGKGHWLHGTSNEQWTHYAPHAKRGMEAMDEIGILTHFKGILCHDHWKSYYRYSFTHALCNAHHLRELTRAWEQDKQVWAKEMAQWLVELNDVVDEAGGILKDNQVDDYRLQYRALLKKGEKESLPPVRLEGVVKRGRIKRSKARNLLERLMKYESDVLRFMTHSQVPFTNNRAENDIRMMKVHQKISGCFRSMNGAQGFCRVRGYLSTCRKQGVNASLAMRLVFEQRLPDFCSNYLVSEVKNAE